MQKKNILILDCGTQNGLGIPGLAGEFNHWFADEAKKELESMGHEVVITRVADPYDPKEEAEKIKKANVIIVQTPAWWMSPPWTFKKYEDVVFMQEGLFGTDGRHRDNPKLGYGTGGILKDKQYMISSTWNAPIEAFTLAGQFFDATGIDMIFMPVHKAFQFLGMTGLPSFIVLDVHKNPTHQEDMARWKEHLKKVFG